MPRKKNSRKAIQKAKLDVAKPKPKARNIGTIGHVGIRRHGLAIAATLALKYSK